METIAIATGTMREVKRNSAAEATMIPISSCDRHFTVVRAVSNHDQWAMKNAYPTPDNPQATRWAIELVQRQEIPQLSHPHSHGKRNDVSAARGHKIAAAAADTRYPRNVAKCFSIAAITGSKTRRATSMSIRISAMFCSPIPA